MLSSPSTMCEYKMLKKNEVKQVIAFFNKFHRVPTNRNPLHFLFFFKLPNVLMTPQELFIFFSPGQVTPVAVSAVQLKDGQGISVLHSCWAQLGTDLMLRMECQVPFSIYILQTDKPHENLYYYKVVLVSDGRAWARQKKKLFSKNHQLRV